MSTLSARSVRWRYLTLTALRWLPIGFVVPISVLLMRARGLSLTEIGLAASVQGFVVLFLELPTGGLSDALGRRPVLILAGLVALVSIGMFYAADSVLLFAAAWCLQGIFRALDSGPLEAWYVDATLAAEPDARIESGLGAGNAVLSAAIASGALLSGGLVALDPIREIDALSLPILVALALTAVHFGAIVLLMTEVRPARGVQAVIGSFRAVPRIVLDGLVLVRSSRVLLTLVLVELFWGLAMVAFERLFPLRLSEVLASPEEAAALMGPVTSGAWFVSAAGAAGVGLVTARLGVARSAAGLRILQSLAIMAMGLLAGPIGVVSGFLACYFTHGASNPLHTTLLHREVDSGHRTTILSMNSMVGQPAGAIGGIALGALADGTSLATAMIVAGVLCAVAAPLYIPAWRRERLRGAAIGQAAAVEPAVSHRPEVSDSGA